MNRDSNMTSIIVTAFAFEKDMSSLPKRIEYEGVIRDFTGKGACVDLMNGTIPVRFYSITDGRNTYHLRNQEGAWSLLRVA